MARVYPLSKAWLCQFRVTHSRVTFYCPRVCCGFPGDTFLPPCARAKATSRARHHNYATLLLAHDCCFTLLNLSFAVRVSVPVTPISVPPLEMPAPCHVPLREPTLKPCESFAVCRTRLSLPHVLRSASLLRQHEKSTQHAKVALDRFKTGRTELRAVAVIALHHFIS